MRHHVSSCGKVVPLEWLMSVNKEMLMTSQAESLLGGFFYIFNGNIVGKI